MKARLRHEVKGLVYVVIDVPEDYRMAHHSFIDAIVVTGKGYYHGLRAGPRINSKTMKVVKGWFTYHFMMDKVSWKRYKLQIRIRDKDDG